MHWRKNLKKKGIREKERQELKKRKKADPLVPFLAVLLLVSALKALLSLLFKRLRSALKRKKRDTFLGHF
jgi:hypothetical protein